MVVSPGEKLIGAIKAYENGFSFFTRSRSINSKNEILKLVKKLGNSVSEVKDRKQRTPLQLAVHLKQEDIVRLIMNHSQPQEGDKEEALKVAKERGYYHIAAWIQYTPSHNVLIRATRFTHDFVLFTEMKLRCYKHEVFGGDVKPGKTASFIADGLRSLGSGASTASGGGLKLLEGLSGIGAYLVETIGEASHQSRATTIHNVLTSALDPNELRLLLIHTGIQIFTRFEQHLSEMGTVRWSRNVTTLAIQAVERIINYIDGNGDACLELGVGLKHKKDISEWFFRGVPKAHLLPLVGGRDTWSRWFKKSGVVIFEAGVPCYYVRKRRVVFITSSLRERDVHQFRKLFERENDSEIRSDEFVRLEKEHWNEYSFLLTAENISNLAEDVKSGVEETSGMFTSWEQQQQQLNEINGNVLALGYDLKQLRSIAVQNTNGINHIQDTLNSWSSSSSSIISNNTGGRWFMTPQPVDSFVGRREELEKLHSIIITKKPGSSKLVVRTVVVTGIVGSGKTELVLRYAALHAHTTRHNVVFVDATSESAIENSFLELHSKIAASPEKTDFKVALDACYRHLLEYRTVVIFDNAESMNQVCQYVPHSFSQAINTLTCLVTSRNNVAWPDTHNVHVSELPKPDAATLFLSHLIPHELKEEFCCDTRDNKARFLEHHFPDSDDDLTKHMTNLSRLLHLIDTTPLTIKQTANYFLDHPDVQARRDRTYVLRLVSKSSRHDFKELFDEIMPFLTVPNTLVTNLYEKKKNDSFEHKVAVEILNVVAYFSPTSSFPTGLFAFLPVFNELLLVDHNSNRVIIPGSHGCKMMVKKAVKSGIVVLQNGGLVRQDESVRFEKDRWEAIKLVREVVRRRSDDDCREGYLRRALGVLQHVLSTVPRDHVLSAFKHAFECRNKDEICAEFLTRCDKDGSVSFIHVVLEKADEDLVISLLSLLKEHYHAGDEILCKLARVKSDVGRSMVHYGSTRGIARVVEIALEWGGPDLVHVSDMWGLTPLHLAATRGDPNVVTFLLNAGSDVNNATYTGTTTPLHLALKRNRVEVVRLLASHPSANNAVDGDNDNKKCYYQVIRHSASDCCRERAHSRDKFFMRISYPVSFVPYGHL